MPQAVACDDQLAFVRIRTASSSGSFFNSLKNRESVPSAMIR